MKLPRNVDGDQLVSALRALGYVAVRQTGSHIRVVTERDGTNKEVVPNHAPIKVGTLSAILKRIARHHNMTLEELLAILRL